MTAHSDATDTLGPHLFTFAIVTDTHLSEEDGVSSSPWPSNKLANGRAHHVFERVRQIGPDFVLHLGDMIHPVPAQPTFRTAAEKFNALAATLPCPIYLTPGNHDIGDKPVRWAPAGSITSEYIGQYEEMFGKSYYSFIANECRFIILNASLINSGLPEEGEQKAWLEDEFAKGGPRTFVSIHYPPYVCTPDEASGYDNIDEPGRSWLLDLVARYQPEAMFSGHVHNFWFDVYEGVKTYILPATSFVRQDYSEMYRVEGGPENGRDDTAKLGFCLVDVHAQGHVVHVIRSDGRQDTPAAAEAGFARLHSATNRLPPVGVDLRHPWAETIEIPANGGVDEFARKWARNDYPLMALWEMGVRNLRVPMQDLANPAVVRRMRLMTEMGGRFTVFCFGIPDAGQRALVAAHRDCVAAFEAVMPWPLDGATADALKAAVTAMGVRLILSRLQNGHTQAKAGHGSGKHYAHFIRHGFAMEESGVLAETLVAAGLAEVCGGIVFRIGRDEAPAAQIARAAAWTAQSGIPARLMVRLAGDDPAGLETDDAANAARVAEAAFGAMLFDGVEVFIDTFDDVDRGYFATNGLVTRRYNPRLAGRVLRHLQTGFERLCPEGTACPPQALLSCAHGLVTELGDAALLLHLPGAAGNEAERTFADDDLADAIDITSGLRLDAGEGFKEVMGRLTGPALLRITSRARG